MLSESTVSAAPPEPTSGTSSIRARSAPLGRSTCSVACGARAKPRRRRCFPARKAARGTLLTVVSSVAVFLRQPARARPQAGDRPRHGGQLRGIAAHLRAALQRRGRFADRGRADRVAVQQLRWRQFLRWKDRLRSRRTTCRCCSGAIRAVLRAGSRSISWCCRWCPPACHPICSSAVRISGRQSSSWSPPMPASVSPRRRFIRRFSLTGLLGTASEPLSGLFSGPGKPGPMPRR